MLPCLGHLIQTFFRDKLKDRIVLSCLTDNRAHRAVLTAIQNEQLVDRLTCPVCFQDSIAALYGKFFDSHIFIFSYLLQPAISCLYSC